MPVQHSRLVQLELRAMVAARTKKQELTSKSLIKHFHGRNVLI